MLPFEFPSFVGEDESEFEEEEEGSMEEEEEEAG